MPGFSFRSSSARRPHCRSLSSTSGVIWRRRLAYCRHQNTTKPEKKKIPNGRKLNHTIVPDTTETRAAYAPVVLVTLIMISSRIALASLSLITINTKISQAQLFVHFCRLVRRRRRFELVTFTFTFVLSRRCAARLAGGAQRWLSFCYNMSLYFHSDLQANCSVVLNLQSCAPTRARRGIAT